MIFIITMKIKLVNKWPEFEKNGFTEWSSNLPFNLN